jgi:hypothetical protein
VSFPGCKNFGKKNCHSFSYRNFLSFLFLTIE